MFYLIRYVTVVLEGIEGSPDHWTFLHTCVSALSDFLPILSVFLVPLAAPMVVRSDLCPSSVMRADPKRMLQHVGEAGCGKDLSEFTGVLVAIELYPQVGIVVRWELREVKWLQDRHWKWQNEEKHGTSDLRICALGIEKVTNKAWYEW